MMAQQQQKQIYRNIHNALTMSSYVYLMTCSAQYHQSKIFVNKNEQFQTLISMLSQEEKQ